MDIKKSSPSQLKWNFVFFVIVAGVVFADQLTKLWVRSALLLGQAVPETGFFRLVYARNTGAAFSIFNGNNGILTLVAIFGVILLLTFFFFIRRPGLREIGGIHVENFVLEPAVGSEAEFLEFVPDILLERFHGGRHFIR